MTYGDRRTIASSVLSHAAALLLLALACATSTAAELPQETRVVSQGEASLTLADIDAYMKKVPEDRRPGMMYSARRVQELLLGLLAQRQLAAEARKLDLQDDPDVQREIALATDEVLARARLAKARADIKLPDFESLAQERYASDKSKYLVSGEIDVQHILIGTKGRSDHDALARAEEVLAKAKSSPADFDRLVDEYSDDESKAENHGIIKRIESGKYAEKFVDAAKSLHTAGELTGPVKTQFGFHIIKLLRHEPDRQKPYAEVKDEILASLRADYINNQVQAHVDEVRNNKLDANPEAVASLRTRYLPPGASLPQEESSGDLPADALPVGTQRDGRGAPKGQR